MTTVGSLFSGIGGFDLAFENAGFDISWQCEKDKDCRWTLDQHWPDVPCYDNVETLDELPSVDVLVGGFPCQDLSVAGRRAGLAGDRSGLFYEFIRLIAQLSPRWVLIENVPGLLSSQQGRDMGTVLGTLADIGYGWAYRVLDAQYFGVAQRRRRVFIVGCLGDAARAAQVLFEPESCDGDTPPRRETGTQVAASLTAGTATGRGVNPLGRRQEDDINLVAALTSHGVGTCGADDNQAQAGHLVASVARPLTSRDGKGAMSDEGTDWNLIAFHVTQDLIVGDDVTPAMGTGNQEGCATLGVAYPLAMRGRHDGAELEMGPEGVYNALRAGNGGSSRQNLVAYRKAQKAHDPDDCERWEEADTVSSHSTATATAVVGPIMQVRRLTPTECERLQGFPDDWTAGRSDSARYRMLGNAVCVPVAEWIARNLQYQITKEKVNAI